MAAPRISVIGTGYLGATHAACLAQWGFDVVGIDADEAKIATLRSGRAPFHEPHLDPLIAEGVESGRLRFSTSYTDIADCDIHFLCLGTPSLPGSYAADVSQLDAAVTSLIPVIRPDAVVVGKSTVPVGTAARLAARLSGTGAVLAWNPEFLREGFAVSDTMAPDRLVIGVQDAAGEAALRRVYAHQIESGTPFLVMDFATAELVKVSANAFLSTKISFINAMAEVCEAAGADVSALSQAIGYDPRIGHRFLQAGLGFGGGCLPKDIRAFMARASELGADQALTFLREVDAINMRRRSRMIDLTREAVGDLAGTRIGILGAAFKPDSDDVRDSPALHVASELHNLGAIITIHDPVANSNAAKAFPHLSFSDTIDGALAGSRAVLHLTEWNQFRAIDPVQAGTLVTERHLIDGRNALDPELWRQAGWTYRALGRPNA